MDRQYSKENKTSDFVSLLNLLPLQSIPGDDSVVEMVPEEYQDIAYSLLFARTEEMGNHQPNYLTLLYQQNEAQPELGPPKQLD